MLSYPRTALGPHGGPMNSTDANALPSVQLAPGFAFRAKAFAGLTPRLVAAVALLLFIRILSSSLDKVVLAINHHDFDGWIERALGNYALLLIMAVPMVVVIVATGNMGPQRGPARIAALAAAVIVSTFIGVLLRVAVADYFKLGSGWGRLASYLFNVWPRYAVLGGMLTAVGEFYRRERASIRAMHDAESDRAGFERQMAEARLQVLQAQIEPHFLFNTLANVRRLYDKDRRAGRTMLENLMRYLEIALPRMRESETTLEHDAELVDAYLRIQQIRMGRRLAYRIDIPEPLRSCPVPPMMILTLVENAIKHGLAPAPAGGRIHVGAHAESARLVLSVADTGVGLTPGSGGGTGLANIRARLASEFGNRATLMLENNEFGGVTATLALPRPVVAQSP